MKRITIVSLLVACSFYTAMRAELLVVQKDAKGFAPLPAESGMNDDIRTVLERYQWPQCIINSANMSEQEKVDLLSSGKPYAEERFIQNKFQQAGKSHQVIFVPTTLYELFCIFCIFKDEKNILAKEAEMIIRKDARRSDRKPATYDLPGVDKLFKHKEASFSNIMKSIYKEYQDVNDQLFTNGSWGYINNQCAQFLFSLYPELQTEEDIFVVSEEIRSQSEDIVAEILNTLFQLSDKAPRQFGETSIHIDLLFQAIKRRRDQLQNIIEKVMDLEYKARKENNALLLRGASFRQMQVGFGPQPKQAILVGSTILRESQKDEEQKEEGEQIEEEGALPFLEQAYKAKKLNPFSISFGNSLFAGCLRDRTASAYYFLMGGRVAQVGGFKAKGPLGYVLFIDKKAYVEHRIHNLFFIPPLITLATLFARGEFFHPRATAAVFLKKDEPYKIKGIEEQIADPSGVLLITRDPLYHAELFSNYLAQHGKILQAGSLEELTQEEQQFAQKVLDSQKEAAQFYKTTRQFKRVLDKKTKRIRERRRRKIITWV